VFGTFFCRGKVTFLVYIHTIFLENISCVNLVHRSVYFFFILHMYLNYSDIDLLFWLLDKIWFSIYVYFIYLCIGFIHLATYHYISLIQTNLLYSFLCVKLSLLECGFSKGKHAKIDLWLSFEVSLVRFWMHKVFHMCLIFPPSYLL